LVRVDVIGLDRLCRIFCGKSNFWTGLGTIAIFEWSYNLGISQIGSSELKNNCRGWPREQRHKKTQPGRHCDVDSPGTYNSQLRKTAINRQGRHLTLGILRQVFKQDFSNWSMLTWIGFGTWIYTTLANLNDLTFVIIVCWLLRRGRRLVLGRVVCNMSVAIHVLYICYVCTPMYLHRRT